MRIFVVIFFSLNFQVISAQKDTIRSNDLISLELETPISYISRNEGYPNYVIKKAYVLIVSPHFGYFLNPNLEGGIHIARVIVKSDFPEIQEGTGIGLGYFFRYYPKKFSFNQVIKIENKALRIRGNPHIGFEHSFFSTYQNEENQTIFSNSLKSQNIFFKLGANFYIWKQLYLSCALGYNCNLSAGTNRYFVSKYISLGYLFTKK